MLLRAIDQKTPYYCLINANILLYKLCYQTLYTVTLNRTVKVFIITFSTSIRKIRNTMFANHVQLSSNITINDE